MASNRQASTLAACNRASQSASGPTGTSMVRNDIEKLAERFVELDHLLSRQAFLAGEFSVADAYAFTIINWANFLAMPLTPYPNLQAYLERVAQRPHVQDALVAEGLVK